MNPETQWSVNESLLQSYRLIFISSQSILIAVGAILVDKSALLMCLITPIGLYVIYGMWRPVVVARRKIVDFYKSMSRMPAGTPAPCTEHEYVNDATKRAAANHVFGIKRESRATREHIDSDLPNLFSVLWIALLLYALHVANGTPGQSPQAPATILHSS